MLLSLLVIIPSVRTGGPENLERSGLPAEFELLQPKGAAPLSNLSFRWKSRPGVRSYRLEIYDRDLEPVYQSGPLAADGCSLPEQTRESMRKGRVYFWKIVATREDDQPVESEFAKFIPQ